MCFGVASKESERGIDVPQDAECSVHGDVLEKRAWVEDALKLCGGEALGVQGELLDTVQTLDWGSGYVLRGHANRLQTGQWQLAMDRADDLVHWGGDDLRDVCGSNSSDPRPQAGGRDG